MTKEFWEGLTGQIVCGKYRLRALVAGNGRSALYLTSHGADNGNAVLKLAPPFEGPVDARVDHAHILQKFDSGLCEVHELNFRYLVTEPVDRNLGTVVAEKPLSPEEMRKMLHPVLDALAFLHGLGLAHGEISLDNVLLIGGSFKLTAESIRPEGVVASPAKDMRALGLLVVEALTQARQPSLIASLPQPFADIVEGSLHVDPALQWTAAFAAAHLSCPVSLPPVHGSLAADSAPGFVDKRARSTVKQIWVYAVAALLLLGESVAVIARRSNASPSPAAVPAHTVLTSHMELTANPPEANPVPQAPAPILPPPMPKVEPPSGQGHAVVVGTFSKPENALHQAELIARQWPQFNPKVSPPSPVNSFYLVLIGSGLSEESAQSLRQRAVASGLPGDTYVQLYPPSPHKQD